MLPIFVLIAMSLPAARSTNGSTERASR